MTTQSKKSDRRAELMAALHALQGQQLKVSISAVARKAGVTPALIHNTYPDVAQCIRSLTGREQPSKRIEENEALCALQAINKRLHRENVQLNADVARLASIVQTLTEETATLRAIRTGKVVELYRDAKPD